MRPVCLLSFKSLLRGFVACLLICLLTSATLPGIASGQTTELLIGIEPEHNIFDQMRRYRYLAEYLSDKLGVEVKLTIMSRYGEVIKRFRALKIDGAFLTSYTATLGIKELDLEPIANPVNLKGETTSQGYIFVRKDSGIRSFADMKDTNIVFVDPATLEGYLFPMAFLGQHGVKDINSFFRRYYFSGSHESAILGVLDGRADIGSAKSTVYNNLVNNDPSIAQELEVIAQSPKVPEVTLCIKSEIDRDLKDKLRKILLQMDKTDVGLKVLKQFQAKSFVESRRADFAIIEEMAQKALGVLSVHGR
jgi:phosphonate transport system substrate-binding protein